MTATTRQLIAETIKSGLVRKVSAADIAAAMQAILAEVDSLARLIEAQARTISQLATAIPPPVDTTALAAQFQPSIDRLDGLSAQARAQAEATQELHGLLIQTQGRIPPPVPDAMPQAQAAMRAAQQAEARAQQALAALPQLQSDIADLKQIAGAQTDAMVELTMSMKETANGSAA